jgi:hypothetical protein
MERLRWAYIRATVSVTTPRPFIYFSFYFPLARSLSYLAAAAENSDGWLYEWTIVCPQCEAAVDDFLGAILAFLSLFFRFTSREGF